MLHDGRGAAPVVASRGMARTCVGLAPGAAVRVTRSFVTCSCHAGCVRWTSLYDVRHRTGSRRDLGRASSDDLGGTRENGDGQGVVRGATPKLTRRNERMMHFSHDAYVGWKGSLVGPNIVCEYASCVLQNDNVDGFFLVLSWRPNEKRVRSGRHCICKVDRSSIKSYGS